MFKPDLGFQFILVELWVFKALAQPSFGNIFSLWKIQKPELLP
jgi:hypothetical protein